jgi:hypothetical protein
MENVFMCVDKVKSEEAGIQIVEMISRIQFYSGELNLLWHNTSFSGQYGEDWNTLYERIVEECIGCDLETRSTSAITS